MCDHVSMKVRTKWLFTDYIVFFILEMQFSSRCIIANEPFVVALLQSIDMFDNTVYVFSTQ